MSYDQIPWKELEVFKFLKDIRVVFDVGSRDDIDYIEIKPNIKLHAFEPNPIFFKSLEEEISKRENTYLNNYGLGDKAGKFHYNEAHQAFEGGEGWHGVVNVDDMKFPIKTLDWYVRKNKIKRIDFLKIDVEGYDYKVLLGGEKTRKLCKYIQYEHWDKLAQFHSLLGDDFDMEYIGYRNVLCINKERVPDLQKKSLKAFLKKGKYKYLA